MTTRLALFKLQSGDKHPGFVLTSNRCGAPSPHITRYSCTEVPGHRMPHLACYSTGVLCQDPWYLTKELKAGDPRRQSAGTLCLARHLPTAMICTESRGHKPPHLAAGSDTLAIDPWYDDSTTQEPSKAPMKIVKPTAEHVAAVKKRVAEAYASFKQMGHQSSKYPEPNPEIEKYLTVSCAKCSLGIRVEEWHFEPFGARSVKGAALSLRCLKT